MKNRDSLVEGEGQNESIFEALGASTEPIN